MSDEISELAAFIYKSSPSTTGQAFEAAERIMAAGWRKPLIEPQSEVVRAVGIAVRTIATALKSHGLTMLWDPDGNFSFEVIPMPLSEAEVQAATAAIWKLRTHRDPASICSDELAFAALAAAAEVRRGR